EYEYLLSMSSFASFFREKHEKGEIPLRVTHNDTKCNNVMFDASSSEHLAVIDLDTVMPGFVAHDFGDAVRFAANPGGEDAEDLASVRLDMNLFKAFASGFVPRINGMVTENELDTLPEGVLCITLELAARFLTDYLQGDVYFKCKKPKHNLLRTRAQTALAQDISKKLPQMHAELNELLKK
ncbi:MAG: phosphotransferase, partial [Clostridia bacterium]|nr:phosphotransferase [Clostridia bacterium]